jgi:uncharacterized iron-regulated membrane protein
MRAFCTVVHRWLGLAIALFLILAGATGAVISWDHEIDEWLNADMLRTPGRGALQTPLALAAVVQASHPDIQLSYMTLGLEEGHAALFMVRPRTGAPALGYDSVYVDPVTAQITGRRDSASIALSRRNLMPWLRHLHESLHVPAFWGSDRWGYWLMGGVALTWLIDSFVALYLTWPPRLKATARAARAPSSWLRRWRPAWTVRWAAGGYRLNFDLHRAGGLWVWGVVIVIAFTSFSLNLYRELFYPVMSRLSTTTPGPYETLRPAPPGHFIEPRISFAQAIEVARREGQRLGLAHPPAGAWYGGDFPFYNVSFFDTQDEMGALGMGLSNVYVSADTGQVLGAHRPWHGTAADVFVQLQLPLHSGRVLGLPGRILMSAMGLVVVMLAVTGIVIWARKRRARLRAAPAVL